MKKESHSSDSVLYINVIAALIFVAIATVCGAICGYKIVFNETMGKVTSAVMFGALACVLSISVVMLLSKIYCFISKKPASGDNFGYKSYFWNTVIEIILAIVIIYGTTTVSNVEYNIYKDYQVNNKEKEKCSWCEKRDAEFGSKYCSICEEELEIFTNH